MKNKVKVDRAIKKAKALRRLRKPPPGGFAKGRLRKERRKKLRLLKRDLVKTMKEDQEQKEKRKQEKKKKMLEDLIRSVNKAKERKARKRLEFLARNATNDATSDAMNSAGSNTTNDATSNETQTKKRKVVNGPIDDVENDLTGAAPSHASSGVTENTPKKMKMNGHGNVDTPKKKKKMVKREEQNDDIDNSKIKKEEEIQQEEEAEEGDDLDSHSDIDEETQDDLLKKDEDLLYESDANEKEDGGKEEDLLQSSPPKRRRKLTAAERAEEDERTLFVGNVNLEAQSKRLKRFFSGYGKVESVRLRSAPIANPGMRKKESVIKREFHEKRSSINAYVRYAHKDSALKALKANGKAFMGKHLRVDRAVSNKASLKRNRKFAVFVGNLNFEAEEELLRTHFAECGEIESVRIVRDKNLCSGKGFGYVNFYSVDSVEAALRHDGSTFMGRELRVQPCHKKAKQKSKPTADDAKKGKAKGGQALKFMKNNSNKGSGKRKKSEKGDCKGKDEYSGMKMMEASLIKKSKNGKGKLNTMQRKMIAIARQLTGEKPNPRKNKNAKRS